MCLITGVYGSANPDHKYIVVYGIKECPSVTPRSERSKHNANETLSNILQTGQWNTAFLYKRFSTSI